MKAILSASLIRVNPFVTSLIPSNSQSGGDFWSTVYEWDESELKS